MFGGGGMNPRKMKQMMKQMGIDVEELDAERVVIETADGDDPSRRRPGDQDGRSGSGDLPDRRVARNRRRRRCRREPLGGRGRGRSVDATERDAGVTDAIPDEDVALVAERAGVPEVDGPRGL